MGIVNGSEGLSLPFSTIQGRTELSKATSLNPLKSRLLQRVSQALSAEHTVDEAQSEDGTVGLVTGSGRPDGEGSTFVAEPTCNSDGLGCVPRSSAAVDQQYDSVRLYSTPASRVLVTSASREILEQEMSEVEADSALMKAAGEPEAGDSQHHSGSSPSGSGEGSRRAILEQGPGADLEKGADFNSFRKEQPARVLSPASDWGSKKGRLLGKHKVLSLANGNSEHQGNGTEVDVKQSPELDAAPLAKFPGLVNAGAAEELRAKEHDALLGLLQSSSEVRQSFDVVTAGEKLGSQDKEPSSAVDDSAVICNRKAKLLGSVIQRDDGQVEKVDIGHASESKGGVDVDAASLIEAVAKRVREEMTSPKLKQSKEEGKLELRSPKSKLKKPPPVKKDGKGSKKGEPEKEIDGWVQCDDCGKWRRIPAVLADALDDDDKWYCKDNPYRRYSTCRAPQELSNREINKELGLPESDHGEPEEETSEDESSDSDDSRQRPTRASVWQLLHRNVYPHRKRMRAPPDEILTCQCRPPRSGKLGCVEGCLNRMLNLECIAGHCPCGDACSNQQFQRRTYKRVGLIRTGEKGFGLQALEPIPKGSFIIEYVGEVIDTKEFEERQKRYLEEGLKHYYFMTLPNNEVIDACRRGNISRFCNHSCEPNCETQKWTVDGELSIGLFAKMDIKEGEELSFDYRYERLGADAKICKCGAATCCGWIGGEPDSPTKQRCLEEEKAAAEDSDQEEDPEPVMLPPDQDWERDSDSEEVVPVEEPLLPGSGIKRQREETGSEAAKRQKGGSEEKGGVTKKRVVREEEEDPYDSVGDDGTEGPSRVKKLRRDGIVKKVPSKPMRRNSVERDVKAEPRSYKLSNRYKGRSRPITLQANRASEVESKLLELQDEEGGLKKQKGVAIEFLRLIVLAGTSGVLREGQPTCSGRDLSLLLDALLKTNLLSVRRDFVEKNGLHLLRSLITRMQDDREKTAVMRKVLRVLDSLAQDDLLSQERFTDCPPGSTAGSFLSTLHCLHKHYDKEVYNRVVALLAYLKLPPAPEHAPPGPNAGTSRGQGGSTTAASRPSSGVRSGSVGPPHSRPQFSGPPHSASQTPPHPGANPVRPNFSNPPPLAPIPPPPSSRPLSRAGSLSRPPSGQLEQEDRCQSPKSSPLLRHEHERREQSHAEDRGRNSSPRVSPPHWGEMRPPSQKRQASEEPKEERRRERPRVSGWDKAPEALTSAQQSAPTTTGQGWNGASVEGKGCGDQPGKAERPVETPSVSGSVKGLRADIQASVEEAKALVEQALAAEAAKARLEPTKPRAELATPKELETPKDKADLTKAQVELAKQKISAWAEKYIEKPPASTSTDRGPVPSPSPHPTAPPLLQTPVLAAPPSKALDSSEEIALAEMVAKQKRMQQQAGAGPPLRPLLPIGGVPTPRLFVSPPEAQQLPPLLPTPTAPPLQPQGVHRVQIRGAPPSSLHSPHSILLKPPPKLTPGNPSQWPPAQAAWQTPPAPQVPSMAPWQVGHGTAPPWGAHSQPPPVAEPAWQGDSQVEEPMAISPPRGAPSGARTPSVATPSVAATPPMSAPPTMFITTPMRSMATPNTQTPSVNREVEAGGWRVEEQGGARRSTAERETERPTPVREGEELAYDVMSLDFKAMIIDLVRRYVHVHKYSLEKSAEETICSKLTGIIIDKEVKAHQERREKGQVRLIKHEHIRGKVKEFVSKYMINYLSKR